MKSTITAIFIRRGDVYREAQKKDDVKTQRI